jgi:hypothetical protein
MKTTGLPKSIVLEIPTYWTPEQALAVFELIDDLRDKIWSHYGMKLQKELREQCSPDAIEPTDRSLPLDDPSF